MSVSAELLCSFELLKPLDSSALKSHIKKGRNKRANMLNSPVCSTLFYMIPTCQQALTHPSTARERIPPERLTFCLETQRSNQALSRNPMPRHRGRLEDSITLMYSAYFGEKARDSSGVVNRLHDAYSFAA